MQMFLFTGDIMFPIFMDVHWRLHTCVSFILTMTGLNISVDVRKSQVMES